MTPPPTTTTVRVGAALSRREETVRRLVEDRVASRLFDRDAALWGPEAEPEARVRLGWVDAWDRSGPLLSEAEELRGSLREAGVDRVVLCGMGGSSLAPEVVTRHGGVPLTVLDSTHPAQVHRALADLPRTVAVVSSKSGSTVETRSHLEAFEAAFPAEGIDPADRIVVVTDPGSPLEAHARERGYRVFLADPEVGGRYSALTAFGLVPSVLAGADFSALLSEAREIAGVLRADSPDNPALRLAAALSADLPERYLCCVAEAREPGSGLADWIEQLMAESTGKNGRGVLPVALPPGAPELRGDPPANAVSVELLVSAATGADAEAETAPGDHAISVSGPLGAQLLLWETATAVLGRLIGVDPFDQPDVESAKAAARALLDGDDASPGAPHRGEEPRIEPRELLAALRSAVPAGGYIAIQAYVDRETALPLGELRARLAGAFDVPVALGFGPRYLHSTGQFHKGGPALGAFLQVLDDSPLDATASGGAAAIRGIDFGAIIDAQARGDRQVLEEHGRPVLVIGSTQVEAMIAELATD